jgi:hypothetical protein
VAVLTGVDGGGTEETSAPPGPALARLETLIEDYAARVMESWRRLVDVLFAASQVHAQVPAPQAVPGDLCEEGLSEAAGDGPVIDGPAPVPAAAPGPDEPGKPGDGQTSKPAEGGLSGLVLLAALSPGVLGDDAAPRRRRRVRAGRGRRGGA